MTRKKVHNKKELKNNFSEKESLFAFIVIYPLLWILLLVLACKFLGICVFDFLKHKATQVKTKVTQVLRLEGDYLTLGDQNRVDLSMFHDEYVAGDGLELVSGNTFRLQETGVIPGEYGGNNNIPVLKVDQYGRVVKIRQEAISFPQSIKRINNLIGPDINIVGTNHQVIVESGGNNTIVLKTPQDIDTESNPTFSSLHLNDLYLSKFLYDKDGFVGGTNYVLTSTADGVKWEDVNIMTSDDQNLSWDSSTHTLSIENGNSVDLSELALDDQTLTWDDTTFELSIEDGNSVDLSNLALWKKEPIGGSYTTDLLTPRSTDVQKIKLERTSWGLTELLIKNEDETDNYAGAVLSLKGSGPDFTNNMFLAKLGRNYYVPSWAGKGVVSSDQPLVIASVKSTNLTYPNRYPYIMFQTGGYYTAPIDRMILNHEGNLGINDFSPPEKLSVGGNIALTDSTTAKIYSRSHELEIGTNNNSVRIYSNNKVHLAIDSAGTRRGFVYVGTNRDPTSILGRENKLFVVLSDSNTVAPLVSVRYSNTIAGPVALYYKARGHINSPQVVARDDVLGGYNSLGYNGSGVTGWQLSAQLRHRVYDVINGNVVPYIEFKHRQPNGSYIDVARMLYDGRFGIGNTNPQATLDLSPIGGDPLTLNIRSIVGTETGILRFADATTGINSVSLRAPHTITSSYTLQFPENLGNTLDVMYNAGGGQLAWDSVEHLLAINVGDHAVLYSNGTNIVGDPESFYWDYDNKRLGINLGGGVPLAPLVVRATTTRAGILLLDDTGGTYTKFAVTGLCNPDPLRCPRISIDTGTIRGFYYTDERWSLGRDEFGSAKAGLRLNDINGIWADRFDLHLVARNYDAIIVKTSYSVTHILTDPRFDVGIGTSSPSAKLQVGDAGDGTFALANAWNTFSDEKLKDNITPIKEGLAKVLELRPVYYTWKDGKDKDKHIGFIAQEVRNVVPEVVEETDSGYLAIDYSKLVSVVVQAVKELKERLDIANEQIKRLTDENKALKEKLANLENKLNDLEKRVEALEGKKSSSSSSEKPQSTSEETPTPTQTPTNTPTLTESTSTTPTPTKE